MSRCVSRGANCDGRRAFDRAARVAASAAPCESWASLRWPIATTPTSSAITAKMEVAPTRVRSRRVRRRVSGRFAVAQRQPRIDEIRLSDREMLSAGEFDGGVESQSTIEIGVAATVFVPSLGRPAQFLVREELGALLRDPGAEARPRAQQRLVHERDLIVIDDEQSGVGERRHDISRPLRVDLDRARAGMPIAERLRHRRAVRPCEEDAACYVLAFVVERRDRALGRGRDRRTNTARLAVAGDGDASPVAARPGLAQRMAEEGSAPGASPSSATMSSANPGSTPRPHPAPALRPRVSDPRPGARRAGPGSSPGGGRNRGSRRIRRRGRPARSPRSRPGAHRCAR